MKQIISKKQLGMYTISIDEDGTLQMQSPTLLKPLTLEPRLTEELATWLAGIYRVATPASSPQPVEASATPTPEPVIATPAEPAEAPETAAQRAIQEVIASTSAQYPAGLAPENRDRFIDQLTRSATLKPLISQGKISRKQITLWVEQRLDSSI